MKSSILKGNITHSRIASLKRVFHFAFPWWIIRFSELPTLEKSIWGFSSQKRSLYRFKTEDHIQLEHFLKSTSFYENSEEIKDIILVTNPRCLGYVFNPVSFYLVEGKKQTHAIIEIGNTFAELKPYYVSPHHFNGNSFTFKTPKKFYISPFLSIDNTLEFKLSWNDEKVSIHIDDYNSKGELEFSTHYQGKYKTLQKFDCLKTFFQYPLHTFFIIFFIHWHALILWLKKVPWYQKNFKINEQIGVWKWKQQKFQATNPLLPETH
jgi:DUF1365 family protein